MLKSFSNEAVSKATYCYFPIQTTNRRAAEKEDEETKVYSQYKKFLDQGPAYFGDLDEDDEELLRYEMETEEAGKSLLVSRGHDYTDPNNSPLHYDAMQHRMGRGVSKPASLTQHSSRYGRPEDSSP